MKIPVVYVLAFALADENRPCFQTFPDTCQLRAPRNITKLEFPALFFCKKHLLTSDMVNLLILFHLLNGERVLGFHLQDKNTWQEMMAFTKGFIDFQIFCQDSGVRQFEPPGFEFPGIPHCVSKGCLIGNVQPYTSVIRGSSHTKTEKSSLQDGESDLEA